MGLGATCLFLCFYVSLFLCDLLFLYLAALTAEQAFLKFDAELMAIAKKLKKVIFYLCLMFV